MLSLIVMSRMGGDGYAVISATASGTPIRQDTKHPIVAHVVYRNWNGFVGKTRGITGRECG